MATITINSTISAIKANNAVVSGLVPLPFCVTLSDTGMKVFLTIETLDPYTSPFIVKETLAGGLQMMQIDPYNFVSDIQPIIEHSLMNTTTASLPLYRLNVQAEKNGTIDTQSYFVYAVPETRQFGEQAQIGLFTDGDILDKLNVNLECDAFIGKNVTVYRYLKSYAALLFVTVVTSYATAGVKSYTMPTITWTINVENACDDDLIVTFINHRSQERQVNIGRYYTERIEQGETMKVLRPYVNIYNSESDKYNLNVDGTRIIEATMRNVSREQMETIKDLFTSNCVKLCKGASGKDIRVDLKIDADIYNTKKPFTDIPMTFTMPKYYTI